MACYFLFDLRSFEQPTELGTGPFLIVMAEKVDSEVLYFGKEKGGVGLRGFRFFLVQEIASVSVMAVSLQEEGAALFSLVLGVDFVVLAQFVGAVCELAPGVVWAEAGLHELFAQLQLFLAHMRPVVLGRSVAVVLRAVRVVSRRRLLLSPLPTLLLAYFSLPIY